jgi:hypothetical protein
MARSGDDGPVMPALAFKGRVVRMLDIYLWFFSGLAMGLCVMGFIAIASFDRGVDSVRRRAWSIELAKRHAVVARRAGHLVPVALRPRERHPVAS